MARPTLFEHKRYLGDRRNQRLHDLDHPLPACDINELIESAQFATFGPDTVPEARNRGYRAHSCVQGG